MVKMAFVGLGVMGYPMAGHLVKKGGHEVTVFNRSGEKAKKWVEEYGGSAAVTPREAASGADLIMSCVGNDDDIRSVVYGDIGILAGLGRDCVFVDHTTASADIARELDQSCRDQGAHFVDAPVSGGQAGAENGTLTVMCGGEQSAFDRAKSAMDCYGKAVTLMGEAGSGQLTKMVNQICIAGVVQGLAEAVNIAMQAGLDTDRVVEVISKGAAQSWQMENRWHTMSKGEFDFGFAVNWMRKDLRICLEEARKNGAALPMTGLVDGLYQLVQQNGGGRWDTSSLLSNLTRKSS
ncbi:MAG: NAD(P)-dependent oxidoreductase [Pseudomonadota bacterium]